MQAMLNPKPSDDPHDIVVIAPDAIRVAPADEEIESLLKDKVRVPAEPPLHAAPDISAGAAVPPVDTTFRATAVNDVLLKSRRRSMAGRVLRGVAALLLAGCIGGAAMAWRYHGEAAQQMIAEWAPLFAQKSSQPAEKTGLTAPPVLAAAELDAANASPAQPATAAQTAAPPATAEAAASAPAAAAAPDEPQSLETMARDLANASQQIEQLKASVEQLKASQQQLVAMVSDKAAAQNLRPKKPAPPPRPVAALAPARTTAPPPPLPPRPYRPTAAPIMSSSAAAPLPPAAGPYAPRPVEPQSHTAAETLNDPELVSVPRPPMPLR